MSYIVMIRTTKGLDGHYGNYRKIALVEKDDAHFFGEEGKDSEPKMISAKARGLIRIVKKYDRIHMGGTDKSYGVQLIAALEAEAAKLNAEIRERAKRLRGQS